MVRVDVAGWSNGKPNRVVYQLIDPRDMKSGFTAMQRTVGFTMSIGARLILEGPTLRHGLVSPVEIPPALLQSKLAQYNIEIIRKKMSLGKAIGRTEL